MSSSWWQEILDQLEQGQVRAAMRTETGVWVANQEVKRAILEAFRQGKNIAQEEFYFDKDTLIPQQMDPAKGVRMVPRGSAIRRGAYVAPGVILMPPSFVNIGAYIDQGSMIDSHALVGSCAQIGKNVHLSAGVQIGGVLEPIGERPVVIEDDAFIGAGSIVVEGIVVGKGAILAPGVVLSKSTLVYDIVYERILEKGAPIPAGAVVIPGTRPLARHAWAHQQGLQMATPIIIKYRDAKSDSAVELESLLRL